MFINICLKKVCPYIDLWRLVLKFQINLRLMTWMDVTDYMQVNYSVAVSWLLCNPIHLIRMFSFAIKQPLLLFLNQRTMSLIWFNRQQWCWIKSPKKGLNARNVVIKIGDGSYYPSNWNQPMSRDQLNKYHFKYKRRMAHLTSPNNNAMLFNQGYKLATTFHSSSCWSYSL